MTRFLFLVLLGLATSVPVLADSPKADPNPKSLALSEDEITRAKNLIKALESPSFAERDSASKELTRMGRLALPALLEARKSVAHPEVQLRCEMLIPHARHDSIRAELDCFLADTEGKFEHNLPGAKQFFEITDKGDYARNLFRDIMLKPENRAIVVAAGTNSQDLKQLLQERRNQSASRVEVIGGVVNRTKPNLTTADVVTLLFGEIHCSDKGTPLPRNTLTSTAYLIGQTGFYDDLQAEKSKTTCQALMNRWVETREDAYSLYNIMNSARNTKLPHVMVAAKRMLDPKVNGPSTYKAMAITRIAQSGNDEEHQKLIAPMFKDETVAATAFIAANKRFTIQMRDLALAMTLLMTKQEPTDYGFKARYTSQGGNDSLKYNYSNFYFDDTDGKADEHRKAAFKKWDEWQAKEAKKPAEKKK